MKLAILGSTGSIGAQALDAIADSAVEVVALSCHNNQSLIVEQIKKYRPKWVNIGDQAVYEAVAKLPLAKDVHITHGTSGLVDIAKRGDYDILLTSIVGAVGLLPTIEAVKRGKRIALANKETLVVYGEKIMTLAKAHGAQIIPVDSEHSAIFQALQGNAQHSVEKLILTATGGPFFGRGKQELMHVKASAALKHPKWSMGKKISIDSATLMNKGLEVIEARWLFDIAPQNIEVVVHPECIIHSLVQYNDSSVMAQLGLQDMRLPIRYALFYPERRYSTLQRLSLTDIQTMHFYPPDTDNFPCLQLAYDALKAGGTAPCILNAANEVLVVRYLNDQIGFYDIASGIERALNEIPLIADYTLEDVLEQDQQTRQLVVNYQF